jgi:ketosteroid isomerase-like protein
MSQADVEVVRRIYDAWSRDGSAAEFIAEDIEYVNPPYAVEPGTKRGRKMFAKVRETYGDYRIEIDRLVDTGGTVVALARYSGHGTGSGIPVAGEQGFVWTIAGGVAVRFAWFNSHREALEAAG